MQVDQSYLGSREGLARLGPRPFRLCLVSQQRSKPTRFLPLGFAAADTFRCCRHTSLPCSVLPSRTPLRSCQRLGIFTTSAPGWTGSRSAAPSATWLGTSVMVVRVRARRYGADDEEDSKLRATLASSALVRVWGLGERSGS